MRTVQKQNESSLKDQNFCLVHFCKSISLISRIIMLGVGVAQQIFQPSFLLNFCEVFNYITDFYLFVWHW